MKKTICIITALAFLCLASQAGNGNSKSKKKVETQEAVVELFLGALVLSALAVGTVFVISIYSKDKDDSGLADVVLEKSPDHANWTPVSTNSVYLKGREPIEIFSEEMTNGSEFYRARVL